jgi:hypothetical protein
MWLAVVASSKSEWGAEFQVTAPKRFAPKGRQNRAQGFSPGFSPIAPSGRTLLQMRVDQLGDQTGPSGLVRCANPATVVSVEVFKELQIVAEIWVGL